MRGCIKVLKADKVMDEQVGFRAGGGCNDKVLAVKQIVEKTIKRNKKIYREFNNLEKAYDNEIREKLWKC